MKEIPSIRVKYYAITTPLKINQKLEKPIIPLRSTTKKAVPGLTHALPLKSRG